MTATTPEPRRADHRRHWVLALVVVVVAGLCLTTLLGTRVFTALENLRSAPHDNVHWAMSQVETEGLRMKIAGSVAMRGAPDDLEEFRKRFDIFYSRIDLIRTAAIFRSLREDPDGRDSLEQLTRFLGDAAPKVDASDERLLAELPALLAEVELLDAVMRDLALVAVESFARHSDEDRSEFSGLLALTSFFALSVIALLTLIAAVLVRQILLSNRREAELRRSEGRLAATVDSALDAVIAMDSHGKIIEFNRSAETIFGFTRAEAIGQPLEELILPPQHRAAHNAGLKRHLETGETAVVGHGRFELSALNSGGEEFPVELAVGRSVGEDGPIFIAYLRDITPRKTAERELREARDKAEAADRAKSDFLAVMSHEMRTPLNGVMGAIDLLRSTALNARQTEHVALAEKSGEMLLRHISDVLDITKIEAGKLDVEEGTFDPAQLVRDLADVTRANAASRDNRLEVAIDPDLPPYVVGDPHRVRQVLLNIVANAIKFTSEGEIAIEARLAGERDGAPIVEFAVRDTGIGIPAEGLAKLFEDFVVLNPTYTRAVGGAGLGLAICRRIVAALDGEIGVDSEPGVGSRFWFRIPLPIATAPSAPATVAPAERTAKSNLVLLAEDNEINRSIAREMLINAGHSVVTANDGVEAVRLAGQTRFDIILMDISMPRMDGLEATKRIRQSDGESRGAIILALTAHATPAERDRFVGAGMQGCLSKPLRRTDLLAIIAEISPSGINEAMIEPALPEQEPKGGAYLDENEIERLKSELQPDFLKAMFEQFANELTVTRSRVEDAIGSRDCHRILAIAHSMHGAAASIGALPLANLMATVEAACKNGQNQTALRELQNFVEVVEETRCEIESQISALNKKSA